MSEPSEAGFVRVPVWLEAGQAELGRSNAEMNALLEFKNWSNAKSVERGTTRHRLGKERVDKIVALLGKHPTSGAAYLADRLADAYRRENELLHRDASRRDDTQDGQARDAFAITAERARSVRERRWGVIEKFNDAPKVDGEWYVLREGPDPGSSVAETVTVTQDGDHFVVDQSSSDTEGGEAWRAEGAFIAPRVLDGIYQVDSDQSVLRFYAEYEPVADVIVGQIMVKRKVRQIVMARSPDRARTRFGREQEDKRAEARAFLAAEGNAPASGPLQITTTAERQTPLGRIVSLDTPRTVQS